MGVRNSDVTTMSIRQHQHCNVLVEEDDAVTSYLVNGNEVNPRSTRGAEVPIACLATATFMRGPSHAGLSR